MPNNGVGGTITPGTVNQTRPAGYFSSPITVLGDPDLIASNILMGKNVFGVNGSVSVESLGGTRWATGSSTATSLTVIGLAFRPRIILVRFHTSTSESRATYVADATVLQANNVGAQVYNYTGGGYDQRLTSFNGWSITNNGFSIENGGTCTWYAFE